MESSSSFVRWMSEAPSVVLAARDPDVRMNAMTHAVHAYETAHYPMSDSDHDTSLVWKPHAADDGGACRAAATTLKLAGGKSGTYDLFYSQRGSILLVISSTPTASHNDDALSLMTEIHAMAVERNAMWMLSSQPTPRRAIVIHDACMLPRAEQHALRKVIESTTTTAMFLLTARSRAALDAALLSRAISMKPATILGVSSKRLCADPGMGSRETPDMEPRLPATSANPFERVLVDFVTAVHDAIAANDPNNRRKKRDGVLCKIAQERRRIVDAALAHGKSVWVIMADAWMHACDQGKLGFVHGDVRSAFIGVISDADATMSRMGVRTPADMNQALEVVTKQVLARLEAGIHTSACGCTTMEARRPSCA